MKTLSGQRFNQDVAAAKRAARNGPVIITDRGEPAFVLQTYAAWRAQSKAMPSRSLLELLSDPASADVEFEPARSRDPVGRPVELD